MGSAAIHKFLILLSLDQTQLELWSGHVWRVIGGPTNFFLVFANTRNNSLCYLKSIESVWEVGDWGIWECALFMWCVLQIVFWTLSVNSYFSVWCLLDPIGYTRLCFLCTSVGSPYLSMSSSLPPLIYIWYIYIGLTQILSSVLIFLIKSLSSSETDGTGRAIIKCTVHLALGLMFGDPSLELYKAWRWGTGAF